MDHDDAKQRENQPYSYTSNVENSDQVFEATRLFRNYSYQTL